MGNLQKTIGALNGEIVSNQLQTIVVGKKQFAFLQIASSSVTSS